MESTQLHVDVEPGMSDHPDRTVRQLPVRRRWLVPALLLVIVVVIAFAGRRVSRDQPAAFATTSTPSAMSELAVKAVGSTAAFAFAPTQQLMVLGRVVLAPPSSHPKQRRRGVEEQRRGAPRPGVVSDSPPLDKLTNRRPRPGVVSDGEWLPRPGVASNSPPGLIHRQPAEEESTPLEDIAEASHQISEDLQQHSDHWVEEECDLSFSQDESSSTDEEYEPLNAEEINFLDSWKLRENARSKLMEASSTVRTTAVREFRPFYREGFPKPREDLTGKFICYVAMLERTVGRGENLMAGHPAAARKDAGLSSGGHPVANDVQLRSYIDELWAQPGSVRKKRGEGPLLPAIRRERVDRAFPTRVEFKKQGRATYLKQGFQLLSSLKTWKMKAWRQEHFGDYTTMEKFAELVVGAEKNASMEAGLAAVKVPTDELAEDMEIADQAIEDLEIALGVQAYRILSDVNNSHVIPFSRLNSDLLPPMFDTGVPRPLPYTMQEDGTFNGIYILHGGQRILRHDECRTRMHAIRRFTQKYELHRAAEVFVDAVALDLERERAKHEGLSRKLIVVWANALSKLHLARAAVAQQRLLEFDEGNPQAKAVEKALRVHKFEARVWLAVARVLNGARQEVLKDLSL